MVNFDVNIKSFLRILFASLVTSLIDGAKVLMFFHSRKFSPNFFTIIFQIDAKPSFQDGEINARTQIII